MNNLIEKIVMKNMIIHFGVVAGMSGILISI
jgi:hypothetical protein